MTWKTVINSLTTVALLTVTTSVITLSVYGISALREHRRAARTMDSTLERIHDSVQSLVQKGNGVIDTLTLPAPNGGRSTVENFQEAVNAGKKLFRRMEQSNGMVANYLLGDRVPDSPGRSPCPEEPPVQSVSQTVGHAGSLDNALPLEATSISSEDPVPEPEGGCFVQ